ncbi:MAG: glutamate--tRNA ligase [Limnochordia bacterium]|jgi:glutamyl-tRNA synthetase|nr:glutamate--tRNA ligase [Limnochordia bacterium]MDI9464547.1 glutamate--tRNA ligase [Bacillota bacterium]NLO95969.1 glutamate--tRNA ligase [Bacillota bacterium]HAN94230.1 glutamate--tRNA ligase [Bacillota bacterium]HOB39622.1 glutamate--tRNA ligase [Limnochordia bacterium]
MNTVRVRFAPSPTGYLHVGGARTALFNWLFARQHRGVFVLRIEDTDLARSTEEATQAILDSLEYLGLDWDEGPRKGGSFGPYFQSERLHLYRQYVEKLMEQGRAYKCYCTPEELDQRREEQIKRGEATHYDRHCLHLSPEERAQYEAEGRSYAIRFKALDEGVTEVDDLIRGKVRFDNTAQVDDFVIVKSDGMPTYNFAVVVDDALMGITHVIRGEDHLSNTPKQIQIYQALGFPVPQFAHIPMILGSDRALLSKRHGATSVMQFKEDGYLPAAMVNYLALLGWSYDDAQTIFSIPELVEKFSLEKVSKNPAVFDMQKLEWMNGVYIRELTLEELLAEVLPFWQKAGFVPGEITPELKGYCLRILKELQPRMKLLAEAVELARYFFTDDYQYNQEAVAKVLTKPRTEEILQYLAEVVAGAQELQEEELKPLFKQGMEKFGVKMGDLMQPLRVAVTGTNVSPGIYEVLALLGRERVLERIERTIKMLKERS